ncbi:MAG TPA: porin [Xanthobacteraceae bacterium]|jgi:predicted porin
MNYRLRPAHLCAGVALCALTIPANAQQAVTDGQIKELQAQIDALQRTVRNLEAREAQSNAAAESAKKAASQAQAQAAQAKVTAAQAQTTASAIPVKSAGPQDTWFFRHKPGNPLTFETPGGEITGYGNLDVSFDGATKNAGSLQLNGATPPIGNFGWMPDISTNLSYFGIRGFQRIPNQNFSFVYQLEAGFEVSATPGTKQSNSNLSNQVNGALFSRNSYIGFASPIWGAVKIGKTDAPYKNSTAAFNPFSGEWGDYAVIMGNTGGDNRVEFGTRLDHAIWYESPKVGGWQWNVLYAPGQNRSWTGDNLASGESDCTGNNDPTSGGDNPPACNDGSFTDAASGNISYTNGGFYGTVAGEWHHNVNRQSDISGIYGAGLQFPPVVPPVFANATELQQYNQDVADEWAVKAGALYKFKQTGTTIGAIVEYMQRDVPADLQFQDERTRWGTWAFVTQEITKVDNVSFGWGHAFRTPGDPGQHNDATLTTADGIGTYAPNDNQADMVTLNYKHMFSPNLTWYSDIAATFNGPNAHYDLGAGGRGVTTDCHDASLIASGGAFSNPHCFTGTTIIGVSTGVQWKF